MTFDELQRRAQAVVNGQRHYMSIQDAQAVLELAQKNDALRQKNRSQGDKIIRLQERILAAQNILRGQ